MIFIKAYKGDCVARINIFNIKSYMKNTNIKDEKFPQNFDGNEYPSLIVSSHERGGTLFVKETVEEIDKLISSAVVQFFTMIKGVV